MTDFLWRKDGGEAGPDEVVMEFLAGEDVQLDRELLLFDLRASAAHANGLAQIGILDDEENARLQAELRALAEEYRAGRLALGPPFEDGHSAIESWLSERLGALGAKIHTGRSRNDQVAVALRLYLKDRLGRLQDACVRVATVLLERAQRDQSIPMPGYTHLQRAMPSSAALWLAGHAEAFIDNAELAALVRGWLDASPLGTASGFGVNLPLPRQAVAAELGFARLVLNPQCAQNSRGKIELQAMAALAAATLDLRRLAWDLSLFATREFGFVRLPPRYCTGSSIMPNKNNPDTVELLRATHAVVVGAQAELQAVLDLPSGYHRDLQATKAPLLRAFRGGLQALALLPELLEAFEWQEDRMRAAITPELFATDRATRRAARGQPFREAYRAVAADLETGAAPDVEASLAERVSLGACAEPALELLAERLRGLKPTAEAPT
ncbi:MAG: argininosuccinate lyase [Xanthomonadales bacterium]|nr:argininosuccinate lyase [Xanthomonadales bacterium]NIN60215.1 argininosuccinate lyase [Xanthomonadales bacterium]NIN75581.1 argininosuccinate lyase [Xanthomonadales bacterium]NIO14270.1 argininosuccinate lyase [Xanthomonadales bacterium]NIP12608.1 argininosuccinate lyase [Xanthomonadales bacterium]